MKITHFMVNSMDQKHTLAKLLHFNINYYIVKYELLHVGQG